MNWMGVSSFGLQDMVLFCDAPRSGDHRRIYKFYCENAMPLLVGDLEGLRGWRLSAVKAA